MTRARPVPGSTREDVRAAVGLVNATHRAHWRLYLLGLLAGGSGAALVSAAAFATLGEGGRWTSFPIGFLFGGAVAFLATRRVVLSHRRRLRDFLQAEKRRAWAEYVHETRRN